MSAPNTDPEKQVRRHRTPIFTTIIIVMLTVIAFIWWIGDETQDPDMPMADPIAPETLPVPEGQQPVVRPPEQP